MKLCTLRDYSINIHHVCFAFQISTPKEAFRKTWSAKYTLRSHFDGVRALAFHPTEPVLVIKLIIIDTVGDLNTNHLNTRNICILNFLKFGFQMVPYSNGQSMFYVLSTRPTIQIPDQNIRKQDGVHLYVCELNWQLSYEYCYTLENTNISIFGWFFGGCSNVSCTQFVFSLWKPVWYSVVIWLPAIFESSTQMHFKSGPRWK